MSMQRRHVLTVGNEMEDDEMVTLMPGEDDDGQDAQIASTSMADSTINYVRHV